MQQHLLHDPSPKGYGEWEFTHQLERGRIDQLKLVILEDWALNQLLFNTECSSLSLDGEKILHKRKGMLVMERCRK